MRSCGPLLKHRLGLSNTLRPRSLGPCTRLQSIIHGHSVRDLWRQRFRCTASLVRHDPYLILGVSRDAPLDAVKAAYRRKALETHPDRPGGSEELFRRAATAYQMLSDPSYSFGGVAEPGWTDVSARRSDELARWSVDPFAPLRTVSAAEADRLFRQSFGGRSVEQVLDDEADRNPDGSRVNHGVHSDCLREAAFNKFLLEAQARADLAKLIGVGEKTTTVSREKLTTEDGRGFLKVKTTTYWRDGRVDSDVTVKEVYRI
eukprot:TRINITY_DN31596_c0_g1_i1.p1 TRINITY_DN31596_c0_g1~~TRINITY_DN31596_c0_g1_i1.p1  ORF type:complete len:276 (+),score=29.61 TRINITY_DN31596_c0_g1_i1:50-829(+)